MTLLPLVLVVGPGGQPTAELAGDLRRLGCRVEVLSWAGEDLWWHGPRPLAVVADLRSLCGEAEEVRRAVRSCEALRGCPLVAVVGEPEAANLTSRSGFDDLILAPYRLAELAARLRVLQWRRERERPSVLRAGPLTLDPTTYEVLVDEVPVDLTLREYELLLFLLQNPGRVYSRQELLDRVWGADYLGGMRTVDVHIRRLRVKIGSASELIETVRGVGYRLRAAR